MKHTGAFKVESGSSAVAIAISPNVLNIEVRTQLAFPGKMPPKGPQNVEFLLWELLKNTFPFAPGFTPAGVSLST